MSAPASAAGPVPELLHLIHSDDGWTLDPIDAARIESAFRAYLKQLSVETVETNESPTLELFLASGRSWQIGILYRKRSPYQERASIFTCII